MFNFLYKNKILSLYGFTFLFLYIVFVFCYNQISQNISDGALFLKNRILYYIIAGILCVIYLVYFKLYENFKNFSFQDDDKKIIWFFWSVFSIVLLLAIPTERNDFYHYLFEDAALFRHYLNPYFAVPSSLLTEPISWISAWDFLPSQHGPMRFYMTLPAALLSGLKLVASIYLYKMVLIFFIFCSNILIYKISSKLNVHSVAALLFFSWNPLLYYETLISGGTDILMMFWILLSLFLLYNKKYFFGVIAFALAFLVKYVTIILMPFFLIFIISKQYRLKNKIYYFLEFFLTLIIITSICFYPFWRGVETLSGVIWVSKVFSLNSFPGLIATFFLPFVKVGSLDNLKLLFLIFFAFIYACLIFKFFKLKKITHADFILYCLLSMAAFLLLAKFWFFPKYTVWLLPLIFLLKKEIYFFGIFITGFVIFSPIILSSVFPPLFVLGIFYSLLYLKKLYENNYCRSGL